MNKNKDNPVPSLTKEELEYLNDNLLLNNTRSHIGESILKKLNGVENSKEQPKYTTKRCSCSELKECDQSCM